MSQRPADGPGSQILLPFAEREWITLERTCLILGTTPKTVYQIEDTCDESGSPLIRVLSFGVAKRKRVLYKSVVEFCDYLAKKHSIPVQRPPLSNSLFRHRDEDLLPFPLSDTMSIVDANRYLGYESRGPVVNFIAEGRFYAYRLLDRGACQWRISRKSFAAWFSACTRSHANLPKRSSTHE